MLAALGRQAGEEARRSRRLGASQIGEECARKVWFTWRWADSGEPPDGRLFRLFRRGDIEEEIIAKDLEAAGITIMTVDPQTMKQWELTGIDDHFVCKLDGIAKGVPEKPKAWHTVEMKTMNDKNFKALVKHGVQKAQPKHYAQMQAGMWLSGNSIDNRMTRSLYVVINKNTDDIYTEIVSFSKPFSDKLMQKAQDIIYAETPPDRIGTQSCMACKWCPVKGTCHANVVPPVNCRTCCHSTPEKDGTWSCARHKKTLAFTDQLAGCGQHIYRPEFLENWALMSEMDSETGSIMYTLRDDASKTFWNGPEDPRKDVFSSKDIKALGPMVKDEIIKVLRDMFDAKPVEKDWKLTDEFLAKGGDDIPF